MLRVENSRPCTLYEYKGSAAVFLQGVLLKCVPGTVVIQCGLWMFSPEYTAALSWSYLLWDIKLIWRGRPKPNGSDIKSWVRFSGKTKIFVFDICVPGVYVRVWRSAYYSGHENGRMVVAGSRPNVVIESAVARCQLRYHAPFFTDSLPLFHAKQTSTLVLSRVQRNKKEKATPSYFLSIN